MYNNMRTISYSSSEFAYIFQKQIYHIYSATKIIWLGTYKLECKNYTVTLC